MAEELKEAREVSPKEIKSGVRGEFYARLYDAMHAPEDGGVKTFGGYTSFQLEQSMRFRQDTGLTYEDDAQFNAAWKLYQDWKKENSSENLSFRGHEARVGGTLYRFDGGEPGEGVEIGKMWEAKK